MGMLWPAASSIRVGSSARATAAQRIRAASSATAPGWASDVRLMMADTS